MLPVAGVARFADALVGLRGVLADGIDVAVVSALHALIDICKGRGREMGRAGGLYPIAPLEPLLEAMKPSSPPVPQPAHDPERLEEQCSTPSPDTTGDGLTVGHGASLGPLMSLCPHSHTNHLETPRPSHMSDGRKHCSGAQSPGWSQPRER